MCIGNSGLSDNVKTEKSYKKSLQTHRQKIISLNHKNITKAILFGGNLYLSSVVY